MDSVVSDVVTTTATKFSLDKRFLLGFGAGVAASAVAVGAAKLKKKIDLRRKNGVEIVTVED